MPWIIIAIILFLAVSFVGWLTKPVRQTRVWGWAMNILRILIVLYIAGMVIGLSGGG